MRTVSRSLTFLALLIVFITLGVEPSFAEKNAGVTAKSFAELRLEVLELDLSSFGRRLSPYQSCLIHYWREEYIQLLDVDTFAAAIDSWERQSSEGTVDLSYLFDVIQDLYFRDLVTLIHNTDLALHEKEFLELFLINILNQGEGRFRSAYQLNALAGSYLSKYPDSPFRQFVEGYMLVELPPRLSSIGISLPLLTWVAATPMGNISECFSLGGGPLLEMTVSHMNIVVTPSIGRVIGSIKTSFSYDGEYWSGSFVTEMWDLSLGYRVKLLQNLTVQPQGGLGLIKIWEIPLGEEGELGFIPTASLGIVFEYFPLGGVDKKSFQPGSRLVFGMAYRRLIHPWEDRFEGSTLVLWLGLGPWNNF